jgi:hypothetical protein
VYIKLLAIHFLIFAKLKLLRLILNGECVTMSEPAGILLEAPISEVKLTALFRRKVSYDAGKASLGHILSTMLDRGDSRGDVLIVNFDPQTERLFLAWILNHYDTELISLIWPVLDALASQIGHSTVAHGCVASISLECIQSLRIQNGTLNRGHAHLISSQELTDLFSRLWSFSSKGQFPDALNSMHKRNYQCKAFKSAWKKYLKWKTEKERPARIAAASVLNPYNLVGNVWCWDGKVVDRDPYTKRDIILPDADPVTFRMDPSGFYADKNYVWQRCLAEDSPPRHIRTSRGTINNPDAIWEYRIIEGAIGEDFTWFDDRYDTCFWTDLRRIYAVDKDPLVLHPLPDIDAKKFRMYGQCFGTDGIVVFFNTFKLPLCIDALNTDGLFIWDNKKVFYGDFQLPLDGGSFRILAQRSIPGRVSKQFRLADAKKKFVFGPGVELHPDDSSF